MYNIKNNSIRKRLREITAHQNNKIVDQICVIAEADEAPLGVVFGDRTGNGTIYNIQDNDSSTNKKYNKKYLEEKEEYILTDE